MAESSAPKIETDKTEKQKVGSSYLVNFYNEIVALTDIFSQYKVFLIEAKIKREKGSYGEEEVDASAEILRNIHFIINKSYIHYKVLISKVGKEANPRIKKIYDDTSETFEIQILALEEYIYELNEFLANHVMQELLMTSHNIMAAVYNE